MGQSLGGYTVTALSGATLDWENLKTICTNYASPNHVEINLAKLWQCQDPAIPIINSNQSDSRIKAVIALNPVLNPIFSSSALGSITIPYLMVSGTDDFFAPPYSQQLLPFTSFRQPEHYLALVNKGTHLSFLMGTSKMPRFLVGPGQRQAYSELRSLSLLFFDHYFSAKQKLSHLQFPAVIGDAPLQILLMKQLKEQTLRKSAPFGCSKVPAGC